MSIFLNSTTSFNQTKVDCAKECPCGVAAIPVPDQWLEVMVTGGFKVWHIIFIIIAFVVTLVVVYCCFHRCRIPRTKQEIEADLMKANLTLRFRDHLQDLANNEPMTFVEALKKVQEIEEKLEQDDARDSGARKRMGWLKLKSKGKENIGSGADLKPEQEEKSGDVNEPDDTEATKTDIHPSMNGNEATLSTQANEATNPDIVQSNVHDNISKSDDAPIVPTKRDKKSKKEAKQAEKKEKGQDKKIVKRSDKKLIKSKGKKKTTESKSNLRISVERSANDDSQVPESSPKAMEHKSMKQTDKGEVTSKIMVKKIDSDKRKSVKSEAGPPASQQKFTVVQIEPEPTATNQPDASTPDAADRVEKVKKRRGKPPNLTRTKG